MRLPVLQSARTLPSQLRRLAATSHCALPQQHQRHQREPNSLSLASSSRRRLFSCQQPKLHTQAYTSPSTSTSNTGSIRVTWNHLDNNNNNDSSSSSANLHDPDMEKTDKSSVKVPKGTRDWVGADIKIRDRIFTAASDAFTRHGGVALDTPVFELKNILSGKYGVSLCLQPTRPMASPAA